METNKLKELIDQSLQKFQDFDQNTLREDLSLANEGALLDVFNKDGCGYYCWLPGFIELLKPQQIVELGAAMGVADICILNSPYQDFELYAITLPEHGLDFAYIKPEHRKPNFYPIVGDDLILSNWPNTLYWNKVDLVFIDSEHTKEQLTKELELYSPLFQHGTIVLFDDIHLNQGMEEVWRSIPWQKFELPLHWSGYGLVNWGVSNDQTDS